MEKEWKWNGSGKKRVNSASLDLASYPLPVKREAWYQRFVHAHKLPCLYGNRKIMNIYPYIAMYTNRVLFVSHKRKVKTASFEPGTDVFCEVDS